MDYITIGYSINGEEKIFQYSGRAWCDVPNMVKFGILQHQQTTMG